MARAEMESTTEKEVMGVGEGSGCVGGGWGDSEAEMNSL